MKIRNSLSFLLLLFISLQVGAQVTVQGVRMWPAPDHTRLVFDVSGPIQHDIFILENPDRLVIDLKQAKFGNVDTQFKKMGDLLKGIRHAPRNGDDHRVVLDLSAAVKPKSFVLRPNDEYGHRLVIDLEDTRAEKANDKPQIRHFDNTQRDLVIAIDAGHGGEDPGASGPRKTREKDVVLGIARQLEKLLSAEYGMRPVMIRDGDYFIPLTERVEKARKHRADFFISIHADAFRDRRVHGASVYVLSRNGASSEHARWLADKENESDLIGGVSLDDKDDVLASVLLDLSMTASSETSTDVASRVLQELDKLGKLHRRKVEHAGFRVLKSPDMPSILVETAFISNPNEERRLRDPRHQRKVAGAIMSGLRSYFHQNPPPDTVLAAYKKRQHVISSGETLSKIARRYQVSLDTLRAANNLRTNMLKVGEVLRIPPPSGS